MEMRPISDKRDVASFQDVQKTALPQKDEAVPQAPLDSVDLTPSKVDEKTMGIG